MTQNTEVVVIGGGQSSPGSPPATTSAPPGHRPRLDAQTASGGAWQHTWDSLRMFSPAQYSARPPHARPARPALPRRRPRRGPPRRLREPIRASGPARGSAHRDGAYLRVETDGGDWRARALVSATGTWTRPFIPAVPGRREFTGRQLHTVQYKNPAEFAGQRVIVVGVGNSCARIAADLAGTAELTWVTQRPPRYLADDLGGRAVFDAAPARRRALDAGRADTGSVASLGDIVAVPPVRAARDAGLLATGPAPPPPPLSASAAPPAPPPGRSPPCCSDRRRRERQPTCAERPERLPMGRWTTRTKPPTMPIAGAEPRRRNTSRVVHPQGPNVPAPARRCRARSGAEMAVSPGGRIMGLPDFVFHPTPPHPQAHGIQAEGTQRPPSPCGPHGRCRAGQTTRRRLQRTGHKTVLAPEPQPPSGQTGQGDHPRPVRRAGAVRERSGPRDHGGGRRIRMDRRHRPRPRPRTRRHRDRLRRQHAQRRPPAPRLGLRVPPTPFDLCGPELPVPRRRHGTPTSGR